MIDETLTSIQKLSKHQEALLLVQGNLQSLQEQVKEAQAARELAQERAEQAEQLVRNIRSTTQPQVESLQANSAHIGRQEGQIPATDDDVDMTEGLKSTEGSRSRSGESPNDEEITHNMLTQDVHVPPPMKFARPRAGAGPPLKAIFKPKPLFLPSPSPDPAESLAKVCNAISIYDHADSGISRPH
jgi:hypothetical protein